MVIRLNFVEARYTKLRPEFDQLVASAQQKDALLAERSEEINRLTIAHSNMQEESARARLAYGADLERVKGEQQRELFKANGE
eukprot:4602920-Alexandrium_andersonii.AAC.1